VIEVRCVHELAQAHAHRSAINALNQASARPDPFSTYEFYDHCLRNAAAYPDGSGLRLWLLLAFRGDELVGYLALKEGRQRVFGLSVTRLDLLTSYVADRPHLVASADQLPQVSAAMWAYLLGRKRDWSLLEFEQQDDRSALLPVPTAAMAGQCRLRLWPNMATGIIELPTTGLAGYFGALSPKARSNVGRKMRGLLDAGDVQLLTSTSTESAAVLFELYRCIEPHSWKGQADVAIGRNAQAIDLCAGLLDPAQPMALVVQVLLLNGAPIAGLISGRFGRGLYAMHVVYDERQGELSPGSAIMLLGIRHALATGCEFVNLLWGSGHYKTRWLAQMHDTCSLQVYRVGSPYYWRRLLGDLRRRWVGEAPADAPVKFNPLRRALALRGRLPCAAAADPARPSSDIGATALATALIDRARRLQVSCLSTAQLAAAMPFATTPARPKRPQLVKRAQAAATSGLSGSATSSLASASSAPSPPGACVASATLTTSASAGALLAA
jgi:hypothetical protein